jgi:DNA-binding transcriptional LysR family regulator
VDLRALEVFCRIMEQALADHAVDPASLRVVLEVTGNEAVRQALKAGAGIAVISRPAIEDDIRCKAVAALRIHGVRRKAKRTTRNGECGIAGGERRNDQIPMGNDQLRMGFP